MGSRFLLVAAALGLSVSACDDGLGPDLARVSVSFVSADAPDPMTAVMAEGGPMAAVELSGTNGTLTIDAMQMVVDEFKLDGADEACEAEARAVGCVDFEAEPYFLDLPLDEVPVDATAAELPAGSYTYVKFETKDVSGLADQVRSVYPDWPDAGSLRLAGSFAPGDGSTPRDFVVYFHAEVKVQMTLDPPLELSDDDDVLVVIEVDPLAWFSSADGSVTDLSELDFGTTAEVVNFEAKMIDGFTKIEIGG